MGDENGFYRSLCYNSILQLITHSSTHFPTIEMQHISMSLVCLTTNIQIYFIYNYISLINLCLNYNYYNEFNSKNLNGPKWKMAVIDCKITHGPGEARSEPSIWNMCIQNFKGYKKKIDSPNPICWHVLLIIASHNIKFQGIISSNVHCLIVTWSKIQTLANWLIHRNRMPIKQN